MAFDDRGFLEKLRPMFRPLCLHRFTLSLLVVALAPLLRAQSETPAEPEMQWHDVTTWGVEGRAWADEARERWFDRLPASAEGEVTTAVWNLSRSATGMMVRFRTDASEIWADYVLQSDHLNSTNMTPIGYSGLDLYARDHTGRWRWAGSTRPHEQHVRQSIVDGLAPGAREYALYLPLRNGVESLSVGVPAGAHFEPLPPREQKPIVFYGTSITHGVSASRPGMVHTAILGRRFDRPVVNLGFSGQGRMDAAIGSLLTRVEAAAFVIDCLPNMNAASVRNRCKPFVLQLRAAWPDTPIVLVEDRRNTNSWIRPERDAYHNENHAALMECFHQLKAEGVMGLYYITGDDLLGHDNDGTIDGSHPNDLGFARQADEFEPVLRAALSGR